MLTPTTRRQACTILAWLLRPIATPLAEAWHHATTPTIAPELAAWKRLQLENDENDT